MKMLVAEFMQAYDLRGAYLEKAQKKNIDLELTISINAGFDTSGKKYIKITFLNIFELESEIPLNRIKGNRIESLTAQQLPTKSGVTEQKICISLETKDGLRAVTFQSRRLELDDAAKK